MNSGASTPNAYAGQAQASSRPVRSVRKTRVPPGTPTPAAAGPSTPAAPAASTPQANYYPNYYGTPAGGAGYNPSAAAYQQPAATAIPAAPLNVPPLPTVPQARMTTYSSRMRTGATLLMQPIIAPGAKESAAASVVAPAALGPTRTGRARAAVNYAEGASDNEFEDDSDDDDFSGTRREAQAKRKAAALAGIAAAAASELDQSYLGKQPPSKFISSRVATPAKHVYP
jgi:chromatin structure-remodeling complex subunit SFH1